MSKKVENSQELRINERITAKVVRVVGDNIPTQVMSIDEALNLANTMMLDLIEINRSADPPVCKIIDASKFFYVKKKHDKLRNNTAHRKIKEIKLKPNIGIGDFNTKLSMARKFLLGKKSVKVCLVFPGKLINFKEKGVNMMNDFINNLKDIGDLEYEPKDEKKKIYTLINPTKNRS